MHYMQNKLEFLESVLYKLMPSTGRLGIGDRSIQSAWEYEFHKL